MLPRTICGIPPGPQGHRLCRGENVAIEYRWAENQIDRLPALAADLVRRRATVIAASGGPALESAAKATTSIPIVFMVAEDPVRMGQTR
jgi:putative tryptophan/tyrosine transport system substrate-binding protein